jgi:hypothetical protein
LAVLDSIGQSILRLLAKPTRKKPVNLTPGCSDLLMVFMPVQ